MKILIVLTSNDQLGDTGRKTGFWLEEFTAPYYVFKDAGADLVLASPNGGQAPLDPGSDTPDFQTDTTARFAEDRDAQVLLANTVDLNTINADDFDAVFYPGGHGLLWDLVENQDSINLLEKFYAAGKPIAAVCHAPAVFRHPRKPNGDPLVQGLKVTGFSNSEEIAVQLMDVVPFSVEDMLAARGGIYSKGDDWASFIQTDEALITGQNPGSSAATAEALLKYLK
ncbi:type 1 glutamine amidotransferase domain-containing protein [Pontiellaceae bacterium B1224]|nr:type 1 glutamine amidotransferase domain-containing protein [Pontiellaceae bacterium B1224]